MNIVNFFILFLVLFLVVDRLHQISQNARRGKRIQELFDEIEKGLEYGFEEDDVQPSRN